MPGGSEGGGEGQNTFGGTESKGGRNEGEEEANPKGCSFCSNDQEGTREQERRDLGGRFETNIGVLGERAACLSETVRVHPTPPAAAEKERLSKVIGILHRGT